MRAKEKVLKLIGQVKNSKDKKGGTLRSDQGNIYFSDVMDLVLLFLSFQPGLRKIPMKSYTFYKIIERVWHKWCKEAEKDWGPRKKDYPHTKLDSLNRAWHSGPGPMGGTMGPAEYYAFINPGFIHHDYLVAFFNYPEGLPYNSGNWPAYRDDFIRRSLPKWQRKSHQKKLQSVFQLAEMVWEEIKTKR